MRDSETIIDDLSCDLAIALEELGDARIAVKVSKRSRDEFNARVNNLRRRIRRLTTGKKEGAVDK